MIHTAASNQPIMERGPWIQLISGGRFYPLSPQSSEVFIEDIAHALGNLCRYNGHIDPFYSVAEHSFLMSVAAPPELQLWALLHDAAESYVADTTRPLKRCLPHLRAIEDCILEVIAERFGLPWPCPPSIKRLDQAMLSTEALHLFEHKGQGWFLPVSPLDNVDFKLWSPLTAKQAFLIRFRQLTQERK